MSRLIGQDTFLKTLKKVCAKAGRAGEEVIKRDKSAYELDKKSHSLNIKKLAPEYKQSVKALKEVSGIRKLVPAGKSALLDMAEGNARSVVDKVSGYSLMLKELTSKIKDVEENEKDVEVARKESAEREFESVKKLLKAKFIENIRYESGVGLFWTYPPMTYKDGEHLLFLGRPEAGLSERAGGGFSIRLPSYDQSGNIGTAHMRESTAGTDYCLGGYDDLLKILAAKRQLSSLIRLFKDYFQSFNGKSRHNTPNYLAMDINLPKVKDDSWNDWKKANPKFEIPAPYVASTEECTECGYEYQTTDLVEGMCESCSEG